MSKVCDLHPLSRRDKAVASILRSWRRLTTPIGHTRAGPGARTLIACSGGADSSALVLALAAASQDLVVAHIVHDFRPREQALADRDAARDLAEALALPFVEASVRVKAKTGNPEANARRERYAALAKLAALHECPFIATAHHAHDQLETLLMRLLRGAGPGGLGGIAPQREIGTKVHPITVIRPMLSIQPQAARRLCREAGWTWREDATNTDISRLRNHLRHQVLPALCEWRPDAPRRAATLARLFAGLDDLVHAHSRAVWKERQETIGAGDHPTSIAFPRRAIAQAAAPVAAYLLRRAFRRLTRAHKLDRLGARSLDQAVAAVTKPGHRSFAWPGVTLSITRDRVQLSLGKVITRK